MKQQAASFVLTAKAARALAGQLLAATHDDTPVRLYAFRGRVKARVYVHPQQTINRPVSAARIMGARGGLARARTLTKSERSAIAKQGAAARWSKKGGPK
jgi:hypothetical protein